MSSRPGRGSLRFYQCFDVVRAVGESSPDRRQDAGAAQVEACAGTNSKMKPELKQLVVETEPGQP